MNHNKSFTVSTLKGGILLPEAIKGTQVYSNYILHREVSDASCLFCFDGSGTFFSTLFTIYFCTIVTTHMNKMHKSGPRLWFVWSCLSAPSASQHDRFSVITGEAVSRINMFSISFPLFVASLDTTDTFSLLFLLTSFPFFLHLIPHSSSLFPPPTSLSRFLTSSRLLPHILICVSTSCL